MKPQATQDPHLGTQMHVFPELCRHSNKITFLEHFFGRPSLHYHGCANSSPRLDAQKSLVLRGGVVSCTVYTTEHMVLAPRKADSDLSCSTCMTCQVRK